MFQSRCSFQAILIARARFLFRTLSRAEQAAKIGLGIAARFHAVTDRVNRLGRLDRPALALAVLDDQGEKIEAIGFRRAQFWFVLEILFDLF
jgi:hypothetical protein